MPEISFKETKSFLDKINSNDNVLIIHHDDGDGFTSGILFYDWCKIKKANIYEVTYNDNPKTVSHIDFKKYNKIIICDIGTTRINLIKEKFSKEQEILFLDHSIKDSLPSYFLELNERHKGYLPTSRTAYELTQLKPWLVFFGLYDDAAQFYSENKKLIQELLDKIHFNSKDFQEKIAKTLIYTILYFEKEPSRAFEIIDNISSINEVSSLEIYSKVIEEKINQKIKELKENVEIIKEIRFYKHENLFALGKRIHTSIGIEYSDMLNIFEYPLDEENVFISARYQKEGADLLILFEKCLEGLDDVKVRGYKRAAGINLKKENLKKFKQNLIKNFN